MEDAMTTEPETIYESDTLSFEYAEGDHGDITLCASYGDEDTIEKEIPIPEHLRDPLSEAIKNGAGAPD